jgi:hypothetical protein
MMLLCEIVFVLGALWILLTVVAACRWAAEADDRQDRYLADDLECKYAAPACERGSRVRSGR